MHKVTTTDIANIMIFTTAALLLDKALEVDANIEFMHR
jgi:hypothetical protein